MGYPFVPNDVIYYCSFDNGSYFSHVRENGADMHVS